MLKGSILASIGPLLLGRITESNAFIPGNISRQSKQINVAQNVWGSTRSSTERGVSREICTFDESDFALPTGEWPYTAQDLNRLDNNDDEVFYDDPRFVTHIDDNAIQSLTDFYRDEIDDTLKQNNGRKVDILDLCSSWISHLPKDRADSFGMVAGVGMNEEELAANEQLLVHYRQDMNKNPTLSQFQDESFDIVCNVVSVDYLTTPKQIFEETFRVLRPGGKALISFSNRCFASKAVAMWLQADDIGRLTIVGSYFHYSAKWSTIQALDIKKPPLDTPKRPSFQEIMSDPAKGFAWASTAAAVAKANSGDPMFAVKGIK